MIVSSIAEIPVYRFPNLSQFSEIRHGVFTRLGGVSIGPFHSLNTKDDIGDKPEFVKINRKRISDCMGSTPLVFVQQVHGTQILVIQKDKPDTQVFEKNQTADAIITDMSGISLMIQTADCQAILMFDPVKRVIANVHSGWCGSIGNIIGHTIRAMKNIFGVDPADISAGIGPSLGPCCAEFIHYQKEIPESFWKYKDSADRFDFWQISRDQLCEQGVLSDQICISGICTRCRSDLFYSYRKEKITGRFASVIGM